MESQKPLILSPVPINREGSNSAIPIKKNPMPASPNTILYTKEAVRFIVLNNILTTVFIDLKSIFSDYFVQFSVLQVKCVPFVSCQISGKGQPFMTQKTNADNRGILLQQFQKIQKWNILYVKKKKKKKPLDNKCKEVFQDLRSNTQNPRLK